MVVRIGQEPAAIVTQFTQAAIEAGVDLDANAMQTIFQSVCQRGVRCRRPLGALPTVSPAAVTPAAAAA